MKDIGLDEILNILNRALTSFVLGAGVSWLAWPEFSG